MSIAESLQQQLDAANQRIAFMESQRNAAIGVEIADSKKALYALAGAHICTPVETYGSNSSWAISDLCRAVTDLHSAKEAAERKLSGARLGIENIAAQARLCLDHVGIAEHQKKWVRNEITNEERIALAQIKQPQTYAEQNKPIPRSVETEDGFVCDCKHHSGAHEGGTGACRYRGFECGCVAFKPSGQPQSTLAERLTGEEWAALTVDELMRVVTTEFVRLHESGCAGMRLEIEPMTAFAVVAALQLALHHPAIAEDTVAPRLQEFIEYVRSKFEPHAPAIAEAIRRGNDPEHDIPSPVRRHHRP